MFQMTHNMFVILHYSKCRDVYLFKVGMAKILITVKTLNIGTPRPATVVVLNIKQFNFTMK